MTRWLWRRGMAIVLGSVGGVCAYWVLMNLALLAGRACTWHVLSAVLILSYSCASLISLAALAIQEGKRLRRPGRAGLGVAVGALGGCACYFGGLLVLAESVETSNLFLLALSAYSVSGLACLATAALLPCSEETSAASHTK